MLIKIIDFYLRNISWSQNVQLLNKNGAGLGKSQPGKSAIKVIVVCYEAQMSNILGTCYQAVFPRWMKRWLTMPAGVCRWRHRFSDKLVQALVAADLSARDNRTVGTWTQCGSLTRPVVFMPPAMTHNFRHMLYSEAIPWHIAVLLFHQNRTEKRQ